MNPFDAYLLTVIFIIGLCFGSFLNVIVYRLPQKKSLIKPPSSCPVCKNKLSIVELIPLIGYLILKGHCRHCGVRISPRYPLVELATGFLFLFVFYHFDFTVNAFFYLILLFLLIGIALIDLEHRIVPNTMIATGLVGAAIFYIPVLAAFWIDLPAWLIIDRTATDALAGFLLGGVVMLLILLFSRGSMGAGDLKMMTLIGLYVGLRGAAMVMFLAFLFGALVGVTFMIVGKLTRKDALPFAPYLSIAAFIQVFWGEQIWHWYINLLR